MINTLFAIKKNMTSTYDSRGRRVGGTILQVSPNYVTQVKTTDGRDGYNAIQLGLSSKKSVKKPQIGHFKKAGIDQKLRYVKEVRLTESENMELGTELKVAQVFSKGDSVKVTAVSKGKGFQGGVRRHGFAGGPKTHGQSDRHRAPGSIGAGTTPGRVYKGKRMAGHMGMDQVSIVGVEVLQVDRVNDLLIIKGGVPGPVGTIVTIEKQGRIRGYIAPPEEKPEDEEEVKADGAEHPEGDTDVKENIAPEAEAPTDAPVENVEGDQQNG